MSEFFAALFAVFLFTVPAGAEDNVAAAGNVELRLPELPDCNDGRLQRLLDEKSPSIIANASVQLAGKRMQNLFCAISTILSRLIHRLLPPMTTCVSPTSFDGQNQ